MPKTKLNEFAQAYLETALWSSLDEYDQPLDAVYTPDDIAPETKERMLNDAYDFQQANWKYIAKDLKRAGHDFWLTRNRHGAGFWDGDWGKDGDYLTDQAHPYGEFTLYVGDDGLIHGM